MIRNEEYVRAHYTFQNFAEKEENREAFVSCRKVAEHPGQEINPLVLCGKTGAGKTHLMLAIRNELTRDSNLSVIYVTAEEFCNELIRAIKGIEEVDALDKLREKYRGAGVLLFDDFQFLIGKEATMEEWFHMTKTLLTNGYQVVLAIQDRTFVMENISDDVMTLLNCGNFVEL